MNKFWFKNGWLWPFLDCLRKRAFWVKIYIIDVENNRNLKKNLLIIAYGLNNQIKNVKEDLKGNLLSIKPA